MTKFIALSVLTLTLATGFASAQGNVDSLCQKAADCMKAGNYQQAQTYLIEAIKQEPNNEDIAVALAVVSNRAGDYESAIVVGVHVLKKLNDKNAVAYREVGFAYAVKAAQARKSGDTANAHEFAKLATGLLVKSLQINKADKVSWDFLIAHLDACGDTENATQARKSRDQVLGG